MLRQRFTLSNHPIKCLRANATVATELTMGSEEKRSTVYAGKAVVLWEVALIRGRHPSGVRNKLPYLIGALRIQWLSQIEFRLTAIKLQCFLCWMMNQSDLIKAETFARIFVFSKPCTDLGK